MLCISTSFWVLCAHKCWSKYFFSAIFNLFGSFQTFFSDFTPEINKKCVKMNMFFFIVYVFYYTGNVQWTVSKMGNVRVLDGQKRGIPQGFQHKKDTDSKHFCILFRRNLVNLSASQSELSVNTTRRVPYYLSKQISTKLVFRS